MFHFFQVFTYNTIVLAYGFAIRISSLWNRKAKLWLEGRKYLKSNVIPENVIKGKRYWFHCASLGEFEQARPLIERIRLGITNGEIQPGSIVLSFFSPSGYEIRKNYEYADWVTYLPLDTAYNAKVFLNLVKPDFAFFVKYEFWYHYLHELNYRKAPVYLVSATFREDQVFFKWYGSLFRKILSFYSEIFVQNEKSKQLLGNIGVPAEISGDTRFDRVWRVAENKNTFPSVEKFKNGQKILVAGSTWSKDEDILLNLLKSNSLKEFKCILAPHEITDEGVSELLKKSPQKALRLSELNEQNANQYDLLIVDSIGQLSSLYAYADIAYVGGGFDSGIHNILEAAVYRIPVFFGPNYRKSEEAKELIDLECAFVVTSVYDFEERLKHLSGERKRRIAEKTTAYFSENIGATETIYKTVFHIT